MIDSKFIPDATEHYMDMAELGDRWDCHPKTAAKRFKDFGGSKLLIGGSVRYPLSQIIAIERESLSRFAARVTAQPKQFVEARERRQKERLERQARRRRKAAQEASPGNTNPHKRTNRRIPLPKKLPAVRHDE
jgi:hypothetical protein